MRIRVQTALQVAALLLSMPVVAAELSPNPGEWPTGDVWPSEAASRTASPRANERPVTPPRDERVRHGNPALPEHKFDIPTEFKFNITLTIRRENKSPEHHGRLGNTRIRGSRAASLRDLR
jgi:hypothetical protein